VALPFALSIPSNAPNVITEMERLQPFKEREEVFHKNLEDKLAQIPGGARPLPPPPKTPPPQQRLTYNTPYDTSKQTSGETSTTSGNPPKADDTNSDTYYDGKNTDYRTDYH
jgi:hypothetical protein